MSSKGGKRPGAGRPKGTTGIKHQKTIVQETALEEVRKMIRENIPELLAVKLELAFGTYYEKEVTLPDGRTTVKVFKRSPDPKSIEWLVEMVTDKAKNRIELSGGIEVSGSTLDQERKKRLWEIAKGNSGLTREEEAEELAEIMGIEEEVKEKPKKKKK